MKSNLSMGKVFFLLLAMAISSISAQAAETAKGKEAYQKIVKILKAGKYTGVNSDKESCEVIISTDKYPASGNEYFVATVDDIGVELRFTVDYDLKTFRRGVQVSDSEVDGDEVHGEYTITQSFKLMNRGKYLEATGKRINSKLGGETATCRIELE